MNKSELIRKYARSEEDRLVLARILDKLNAAESRNAPASTHFLNGRERALCSALLAELGSPEYRFWGGYEAAERTVLTFLPGLPGGQEAVAFIRAQFPASVPLGHRDFLGALMGAGVKRETVGDILVSPGCADIAVLPEILPFLLNRNLETAGRARLRLSVISRDELRVPEESFTEVRATVPSMRLDCLIACAFKLSRSDAADLVGAGRVALNFLECAKPDRIVREGDLISVRGMGRAVVAECGRVTRKGRIAVGIKKYS